VEAEPFPAIAARRSGACGRTHDSGRHSEGRRFDEPKSGALMGREYRVARAATRRPRLGPS